MIASIWWTGHALTNARLEAKHINFTLLMIQDEDNQPSDHLLNISHKTVRLRDWLDSRLRQLAREQRIQDARSIRDEFLIE